MQAITCTYQGGNEYHVVLDKLHIATFHVVLKQWYPQYHANGHNAFGRKLHSREAAIAWIRIIHKRILEGKQP